MLPEDYCGICGQPWPDCECGTGWICSACDMHVEDCDCPEGDQ